MSKAKSNVTKLRDVVDVVADYGADPTGVSDSTSAIQNALSSGFKNIFFPAGTYLCLSAIHLPNTAGLNIYGSGRSSTIYFNAASLSGGTTIYLGNQLGGATYTSTNVKISNLSFKGHYTVANTAPGGGVSQGINFGNAVSDLEISGCYFSNCSSYSLQVLSGTDVKITGNSFYMGYRAAICLGSAPSNYVRQFVVANNIIDTFVNTAVDADGVLMAGAQYGSVTGNTGYTIGSTGIKLGTADYVTVTGNKLRKVVDGIKVQNGGTFNTIVGNNVNQCRSGVAVINTGGGPYTTSHIHIADNVIEDCTSATNWIVTEYGATAPGSNYGILMGGALTDNFNYISVTNNQISNAARGVSLATSVFSYAFVFGNQGRDGVTLGYVFTDTVSAGSVVYLQDNLAGTRDYPVSDFRWINTLLLGGATDSATLRRQHTTGSAAPAAGTWAQGDLVYNTAPASAGFVGWVCTVGGTPGTWKTFGLIS